MPPSNRFLTNPDTPYVIAEASGNHNQDRHQARLLVQAAAASGASAIKWQTFTAEEICADVPILFGHDAAHDAWCRSLGVTRMRDLFAKGGLPRAWHQDLKQEAEDLGIDFLSTPFSVDAAKFLVEELGVRALKIASGDLTFTPLHQYAASTGLPVIISTGGATLDEIDETLQYYDGGAFYASSAVAHATAVLPILPRSETPSTQSISSSSVTQIILLHCRSVYPCDERILDLESLATLRNEFDAPVGLSDHTLSTDLVPAMAVAYGAVMFEKHLRLATDTSSVDVGHSLDPDQFRRYVETIRICCEIRGNGFKEPHPLELHDRVFARRDPSDWKRPVQRGREGEWA